MKRVELPVLRPIYASSILLLAEKGLPGKVVVRELWLSDDEDVVVELTPWITAKLLLGVYDLQATKARLIGALYRASFDIYDRWSQHPANSPEPDDICVHDDDAKRYDCGVYTAERLAMYVAGLWRRADPMNRGFLYRYIRQYLIPIILDAVEEATVYLAGLLSVYDDYDDVLAEELRRQGLDPDWLDTRVDEIIAGLGEAGKHLRRSWQTMLRGHEENALGLLREAMKKLDEALDLLVELGGEEYPGIVYRGEIERRIKDPEKIIEKLGPSGE